MERTKWDGNSLRRVGINALDASFLSTKGMPNLTHDELVFSAGLLDSPPPGTDCHQIGTFGIMNDVALYVRESRSGVWVIDSDTKEAAMINSSCMAFSHFIAIREKYLLDFGKLLPPNMQQSFVDVIVSAMKLIDPAAFSESGFWGAFMGDVRNYAAYYDG